MPRFDKPKKRGARVTLYKDASVELDHINECEQRLKDEVRIAILDETNFRSWLLPHFYQQAPARGGLQFDTGRADYDAEAPLFESVALSKRTLQGLTDNTFTSMTRIQVVTPYSHFFRLFQKKKRQQSSSQNTYGYSIFAFIGFH